MQAEKICCQVKLHTLHCVTGASKHTSKHNVYQNVYFGKTNLSDFVAV